MGRKRRNSKSRRKRVPARRLTPSLQALRSVTARSAITNGTRLLPKQIDERSAWARRFHDLIAGYSSDAGGVDRLSEGERALVRTIASTQLQLELMEARFAQNEDGEATGKTLDRYLRAGGALNRLLRTLGLKRRSRDVTPDLRSYIEQKATNGRAAE
jgi:hypothetical protein